ncbi:H-NS family nucleoid-associated regulatory protein [Paraburkholderia bonniea]|uniref:H-NS histone family protein n=1 Tax=Paraburkholderia bonniea TaxID=2152891 RepID=UPI0012916733|nr:H-NS histone family protein [Paraburkholderia bonniea]
MAQYADLKAQIAKLQVQADQVRQAEINKVIEEIKAQIEEYGLTAQDLGFVAAARRGRPPRKEPLPPKYHDPKTGNTWSGRGKPPKWISGKNRERFLIGKA